MKTDRTQNLIHKYISNTLKKSEYRELNDRVKNMGDDLLETLFATEWDTFETKGRFSAVLLQIREQLSAMFEKSRVAPKQFRIRYNFWLTAVAVLIPLLLAGISYLYIENSNYKKMVSSEFSISTRQGQQSTVVLPDGTKIHLNSKTVISYTAAFANTQREVRLTGEAFFEVSHNPQLPFIVKTATADIRVLGTVFDVNAYPDNTYFETTLAKGSVEVTPVNGLYQRKFVLKPGEKVHYNKLSDKWNVGTADLWLVTAWQHNDLVFQSKTLTEVFKGLENYYGVEITIEGTCPQELFTGAFHDDSVSGVLLNLQQHYKFSYMKTGNRLTISFN